MKSNCKWTRRDIWLGLLFLFAGILIVAYSLTAMLNGYPIAFWGLGWVLGPILILLGGNGVIRSMRAPRSEVPPDKPVQTEDDSRRR